MEKSRRKVRYCVAFVVIAAVVVGILYYYGQYMDESGTNEGTLIANIEREMKRLCR